VFRARLKDVLHEKNLYIEKVLGGKGFTFESIFNEYSEYAKAIKQYSCDTSNLLYNFIKNKKKIMFESAQGALLDINFGTYPYVTSSHTIPGSVPVGSGISHFAIKKVIAVTKAYTTRVGGGPFPTELEAEEGNFLREKGGEYGATTGRPRRCGWLDGVLLRYVCRICGVNALAITKLDVLSGLKKIKVCTAYRTENGIKKDISINEVFGKIDPVYEELPGWSDDIRGIKKYSDLPKNARQYLKFIEKITGVKIIFVSTGQSRDEAVVIQNPFQ